MATGSGFLKAFEKLLVSSKHSDVSIYFGPEKVEFRAHYAILSVHTKYFDAAKERGFAEGLEDKFYFPEGHPHAFYRALQYMYTGDYSSENNQLDNGEEDDRELLKHPRVNAIADLFDIEGLKELCATRFTDQLVTHWISDTFVDSVREIYSTSTKSEDRMRKAIVDTTRTHAKDLYKHSDFKALIKGNAEFSGELTIALLDEGPKQGTGGKDVYCNHCGCTQYVSFD
ncbi:MAG: hypothetical protein M1840_002037 [Geoglossum simile]|nr:MAG: hypothetical protein M1840_002037 [Geoglossum simile]